MPIIASLFLASQVPAVASVAFKTDAKPMTLTDAERLGPTQMANAWLVAGHPSVERATIGPQGMSAPLPPGPAVETGATVLFVPAPASDTHFCQRIVADLTMSPISRDVTSRQALYRPTAIKTDTQYRWAGGAASAASCAKSGATFFKIDPNLGNQQFGIISAVAAAGARSRGGRRPSFPVTVDDREGREMLAFEAGTPNASRRPGGWTVYTDGTKALAAVPFTAAFAVYPTSSTYADPFTKAEISNANAQKLTAWTIRASDWTVGVLVEDGRIKVMRLIRAVPPPF